MISGHFLCAEMEGCTNRAWPFKASANYVVCILKRIYLLLLEILQILLVGFFGNFFRHQILRLPDLSLYVVFCPKNLAFLQPRQACYGKNRYSLVSTYVVKEHFSGIESAWQDKTALSWGSAATWYSFCLISKPKTTFGKVRNKHKIDPTWCPMSKWYICK